MSVVYAKTEEQTDLDFETEMELLGMHFKDLSKIRGGPGNPTVNIFEPTYDRHGEIRIIGVDLSLKSDMTYYCEYLCKPYEEKEPQLRPDGTVRRTK